MLDIMLGIESYLRILPKLFKQFKVSKIVLVLKLEEKSPRAYCLVETEAAWNNIPGRMQVKDPGAEYFERKHQNPEEIIQG